VTRQDLFNQAKAAASANSVVQSGEPAVSSIPAAKPATPVDFAKAPRAAKVKALSDVLEGQIAPGDVARMSDADWQKLADGLGIKKPSKTTIADTIFELRKRAAPPPAAAEPTMLAPSEDLKNALISKPGALKAAMEMQKAVGNASGYAN
jgi:hypothetical protein